MTTDPLIPPQIDEDPQRRIFAEQVDRGNGLADLQGVRIFGTQIGEGDHTEVSDVLALLTRIGAGDPSQRGLTVMPQTFTAGGLMPLTGQTTSAYAAGDQVGDPTPWSFLGSPFPDVAGQIAVRNMHVKVLDLGLQLDELARLWVANAVVGPIGDAGDNEPVDFGFPAAALAAPLKVVTPQRLLSNIDPVTGDVTYAPARLDDLASGRSLTFETLEAFTMTGGQSLVLEVGTAATWSATDQVFMVWSAEIIGYAHD